MVNENPLIKAMDSVNWKEELERLVKSGIDINSIDGDKQTALWWAVEQGYAEQVEYLLKLQANPNLSDYFGKTPLMVAVVRGGEHVEKLVSDLIDAGADVNAQDWNGKTALMNCYNLKAQENLLNAGADVNARDRDGMTALRAVIEAVSDSTRCYFIEGDYVPKKLVSNLIDAGADVNIPDDEGKTPLMVAVEFAECCRNRDTYYIEKLLKAGADINAQDKEGRTVRDYAKKYIKSDGLKKKLEKLLGPWDTSKKEINAKATSELVSLAKDITAHSFWTLTDLVNAGADVNAVVDNEGRTVLMEVAQHGLGSCAKILLKNGAKIDAADKNGDTALMYAMGAESDYVQQMLLSAGADTEAANNEGMTALMWSVVGCDYERNTKQIENLLKAGANINAQDKKGRTVRDYAKENIKNGEMLKKVEKLLDSFDTSKKQTKEKTTAVRSGSTGQGKAEQKTSGGQRIIAGESVPEPQTQAKETGKKFAEPWREYYQGVAAREKSVYSEDEKSPYFKAEIARSNGEKLQITATPQLNVSLNAKDKDDKNKVPDYKDFDDLVKFAKQQNKKITFGDIKSEEFRARLLLACLENDINIKELPDLSSMKNIEAETRQRLMKQKVKLLRKVAKDKSYNSLGAEAKVKKQKAEEVRQTIRNGRQNGQADAEKYAAARRLIQQRQQEFRG